MPNVVDSEHRIGARDRPDDRAIAAIATRQHGVIARGQLVDLGFGRGAIRHRVSTGRLHRVRIGVYAVGHRKMSGLGRWTAAVLACGPEAVLSHRSAAALWGLLPSSRALVDVTVPGRSRHGRPGIVLHQVRHLHPGDRTVEECIPVTTVSRTLLDLAEVAVPRHLERALQEAERLRLFDLGAIERLIARSRGRHGLRALRTVLGEYRGPAPTTRSELERRFLDLCRDARLPPPAVNTLIAGIEVDVAWHGRRLVIELDGHSFHRTRRAFERDRIRDAALQLAGYRVVRITHRRLETDPTAIVETIRQLLACSTWPISSTT